VSPTAGLTANQRLAEEALVWFRTAVALADENKQLRRWMTEMLIRAATRDELLELGRQEIERRWPS